MKKVGMSVTVVVALFVIAFGLANPAPTLAQKELKVGALVALTGSGAAWGLPMKQCWELQAEQINKAGGVSVGKDKYIIKLIAEDDKYSPDTAVNAVHKLVYEDKVKYILGPIGSIVTLTVQPVTEPNHVVLIPGSWSHKTLGPDKPYSWRLCTTPPERAYPMYSWMVKTYPGTKKWAFLSVNDETGRAVLAASRKGVLAAGGEVVAEEFYERGGKDFYPILTRILAKKVDVIDLGANPPGDGAATVKQARELGFKGKIVAFSAYDMTQLAQLAGKENAEGFLGAISAVVEGPLADQKQAKFKQEFIARWGESAYNTAFWDDADLLYWLIHGLQKAGNIDPERVNSAMIASKEWDNPVFGRCKWGGKATYGIDRQQYRRAAVVECRSGKGVALTWLEVVMPK